MPGRNPKLTARMSMMKRKPTAAAAAPASPPSSPALGSPPLPSTPTRERWSYGASPDVAAIDAGNKRKRAPARTEAVRAPPKQAKKAIEEEGEEEIEIVERSVDPRVEQRDQQRITVQQTLGVWRPQKTIEEEIEQSMSARRTTLTPYGALERSLAVKGAAYVDGDVFKKEFIGVRHLSLSLSLFLSLSFSHLAQWLWTKRLGNSITRIPTEEDVKQYEDQMEHLVVDLQTGRFALRMKRHMLYRLDLAAVWDERFGSLEDYRLNRGYVMTSFYRLPGHFHYVSTLDEQHPEPMSLEEFFVVHTHALVLV